MVTEPTHIDGKVLDLVLTDVPDIVGVRVGSTVGTSDHIAIFIDVVLDQAIPHLACRQEVYLKNSVNWELVRVYMKVLNWNGIIRFPCLVSLFNDALLRVIRIKFPSGRLWSEQFMERSK